MSIAWTIILFLQGASAVQFGAYPSLEQCQAAALKIERVDLNRNAVNDPTWSKTTARAYCAPLASP